MRYLGHNERSSCIGSSCSSNRITTLQLTKYLFFCIGIYSIVSYTLEISVVNDIITNTAYSSSEAPIAIDNKLIESSSKLTNPDEHILRILSDAKITITSIDEDKLVRLPTWEAITSMYGDKPVILGLETCERYRNMVKPKDRTTGPAGLTNTGTNLLYNLISDNCIIDGKILWQAPWGKHSHPTNRLKRAARSGKGINQTEFFPLTMIKDPFSWMNSQCRHDYGITHWNTTYDKRHCPHLIRENIRDHNETAPVSLFTNGATHDSLLDSYNWWYWYQGWETERRKFPHLSIRYEDLLFHGREVSRIACECVGGSLKSDFHFGSESAKGSGGAHKGASGLVDALIRYGDPTMRLSGFSARDLSYARRNDATAELMRKYNYSYPVFK